MTAIRELLHQPNPEGKPNLYQGLIAIRKLHMRVIEETGFSTADEMLYPENLTYLSDVYVLCCSRRTFR